jgi:hypothetical protein
MIGYKLVPVDREEARPAVDWYGRPNVHAPLRTAACIQCAITGEVLDGMGGPARGMLSPKFVDWMFANREMLNDFYKASNNG